MLKFPNQYQYMVCNIFFSNVPRGKAEVLREVVMEKIKEILIKEDEVPAMMNEVIDNKISKLKADASSSTNAEILKEFLPNLLIGKSCEDVSVSAKNKIFIYLFKKIPLLLF